jgi:hypothetical protein
VAYLTFYVITSVTASVASWSDILLQTQRSRIRMPALQHFMKSSGSETGSTQPPEDIEELLERKSSGSGLEN